MGNTNIVSGWLWLDHYGQREKHHKTFPNMGRVYPKSTLWTRKPKTGITFTQKSIHVWNGICIYIFPINTYDDNAVSIALVEASLQAPKLTPTEKISAEQEQNLCYRKGWWKSHSSQLLENEGYAVDGKSILEHVQQRDHEGEGCWSFQGYNLKERGGTQMHRRLIGRGISGISRQTEEPGGGDFRLML